MVVAVTPRPRWVFDRRAASESGDPVAGSSDGGPTGAGVRTGDRAADGGELVAVEEIAAAELTSVADGVGVVAGG